MEAAAEACAEGEPPGAGAADPEAGAEELPAEEAVDDADDVEPADAPVAAAAAGAQEGQRCDQENGGAAASEPGGTHHPIPHLAGLLVALNSSTRS